MLMGDETRKIHHPFSMVKNLLGERVINTLIEAKEDIIYKGLLTLENRVALHPERK